MAETAPLSAQKLDIKRRFHRKSRKGCRNCRIRRVKVSMEPLRPLCLRCTVLYSSVLACAHCSLKQCDEIHPQCQKCRDYGVLCNFKRNVADMESLEEFNVRIGAASALAGAANASQRAQPARPLRPLICCGDETTGFELDRYSVGQLSRYKASTAASLETYMKSDLYDHKVLKLAFQVR